MLLPSNGAKIDGIVTDSKKKEDCKIVKKEKMPVLLQNAKFVKFFSLTFH